MNISELKNLGPKSMEMFAAVGIHSPAQIRKLGSVGCFLLVKERFPRISVNLLWAVEGFLQNKDWRDVSPERKEELIRQLEQD